MNHGGVEKYVGKIKIDGCKIDKLENNEEFLEKVIDTDKVYIVCIDPKDELIKELLDEKNNGCNISAQLWKLRLKTLMNSCKS